MRGGRTGCTSWGRTGGSLIRASQAPRGFNPARWRTGSRRTSSNRPGPDGGLRMQPRGQLWVELQRVCQDFRDFSGLEPKEAGQVLVLVLRNLLAEEEAK